MRVGNLEVSPEHVRAFCVKWNLDEFALFGSALRDDFQADSDVDVLIHFAPGGVMTLEAMTAMREELAAMFGGREVDLVERQLVTNPYRRHEILTHREILYAA